MGDIRKEGVVSTTAEGAAYSGKANEVTLQLGCAADHPARVGWAGRISRQVSSSSQRIAFATGLPTAPCTTPYGDLVIRLAIQNRQDYVRLHSHEYHLMAESVDRHLRMGKIALTSTARLFTPIPSGWPKYSICESFANRLAMQVRVKNTLWLS
jgi:hypothetical protein